MPNLAPKNWSKKKLKDDWFQIVSNPEDRHDGGLCIQILRGPFTHVILKYENFKPLGKILFPGRHLFTSVSYLDNSSVPVITNINFNFKEVERTNKPLKFPFNVPSKYDVKKI